MTAFPILRCVACDSELPSDASFCPRCGAAVPSTVVSRRTPSWWVALGAACAVALALGLVVWRGYAIPRTTPPAASPAVGAVALPDMSRLTPQQQFDWLYDRVMQALRTGDTATVTHLAPMVLGASQLLDSADTAIRRRVAVLRFHLGDTSAGRALQAP